MNSQIDDLLTAAKLRKTEARRLLLSLFLNQKHALSHSEIEQAISGDCDRVTIYRILASFEESGILHKIMGGDAVLRYAMCDTHACGEHHHHDAHLHFQCNHCKNIYCLDLDRQPSTQLPSGFVLQAMKVSAEGICADCHVSQNSGKI
jgi:Fur family transcriptional regulator, ferric uptake regulator